MLSYDLAFWDSGDGSPEEIYGDICEGVDSRVASSAEVLRFRESVLDRWISFADFIEPLDYDPDADVQSELDRYVLLGVPFSLVEEMREVIGLAHDHGLTVYDPQSGQVLPRPRASGTRNHPDRSPAHNAVELLDASRLRDLLDAGADVEDDAGDGWTLLRHAIEAEADEHDRTGAPLHVDVTALLLARGADPLRIHDGMSVPAEAEERGHWLAAQLIRGWIGRPGSGGVAA